MLSSVSWCLEVIYQQRVRLFHHRFQTPRILIAIILISNEESDENNEWFGYDIQNKCGFHLGFHWSSKVMHAMNLSSFDKLLSSWVINEFENPWWNTRSCFGHITSRSAFQNKLLTVSHYFSGPKDFRDIRDTLTYEFELYPVGGERMNDIEYVKCSYI